ncbi:Alpha/Beta hydrolase protein [Mycena leptocephala]|nr:Alpha/Beta hydrolase protein [Mycena leptocephala]
MTPEPNFLSSNSSSLHRNIIGPTFPMVLPLHSSSYSVEDFKIAVEGGEITVPEFPVLFWTHGGGFVAGDLELDDFPHRILSVKYRISTVSVEYRLAPEHPFPIGLNDCYSALKWTVENAKRISGDPAKGFLVGGASAEGNLATVLAHRARDDPFFQNHKITGQILQFPGVLHRAAYPPQFVPRAFSHEQKLTDPNLASGLLQVPPSDPEGSPLLAPAYIQVCGLDPLRDEVLLYERVLREAGVKTRLDIYPGLPHGFHMFEADLNAGLVWLLDAKI